MARLRRKALASEHETRFPLAESSAIGVSADWGLAPDGETMRLRRVILKVTSDSHRYLLELEPHECDRVRRWLVEQALDKRVAVGAANEAAALRELADLLDPRVL